MPPKKKARVSQAVSPEPGPETPAAATPDKTDELVLNDPWTDEEEIGLFKGLMRWKPTGIHKHFRLMALHSWLLENNYIHPRNEHTKPAGIWSKLNTLYDLTALDARENARQLSPEWTSAEQEEEAEREAEDDAAYSLAANKIENEDFSLPPMDGFDEMMWKARLPREKDDESDYELPELNLAEQPPIWFVPSFSIEPSESATPSSKRGRGASRGRGSKAASDTGARRRSTRNTESVADKEEEEAEEEEAEEEDEEGGDEDDEEESEEEEEGEDQGSIAGRRRGRPSKTTRGKGTTRGRGRGRGRVK